MKVFNAPQVIENNKEKAIFLAGTIDNGSSVNWQEAAIKFFSDSTYNIYNPRRDDWDHSWQSKIEDQKFSEQVNWELDAMEKADLIVMNFLPKSLSPVTLLEFGLFAKSPKLMVCCPDEFWRSGNIYMVCNKYDIPFFKTMDELLLNVRL